MISKGDSRTDHSFHCVPLISPLAVSAGSEESTGAENIAHVN